MLLPGSRADALTEAQERRQVAGSEMPDSAGGAGSAASSPLPGSHADAPAEAQEGISVGRVGIAGWCRRRGRAKFCPPSSASH